MHKENTIFKPPRKPVPSRNSSNNFQTKQSVENQEQQTLTCCIRVLKLPCTVEQILYT